MLHCLLWRWWSFLGQCLTVPGKQAQVRHEALRAHDSYLVAEFAVVLYIPVCFRLVAWCLASWYPRATDLNLDTHLYRGVIVRLAGALCFLHSAIAAKPFPTQ